MVLKLLHYHSEDEQVEVQRLVAIFLITLFCVISIA